MKFTEYTLVILPNFVLTFDKANKHIGMYLIF